MRCKKRIAVLLFTEVYSQNFCYLAKAFCCNFSTPGMQLFWKHRGLDLVAVLGGNRFKLERLIPEGSSASK